ncbi:MAG TPA: hypothetical protein VF248_01495 [Nitrososphaeraceae archaeon]
MTLQKAVAIFLIATSLAIGALSATNLVLADKSSGSNGLEKADDKVHENTGPVSDQDIKFHEGLCQGGHSTEALDNLGGCNILSDPGESDENRNDD